MMPSVSVTKITPALRCPRGAFQKPVMGAGNGDAGERAGQFVIVRVREGGERIPLTIADYDREAGELTIVVQQVGVTTNMLGSLDVGDDIRNTAVVTRPPRIPPRELADDPAGVRRRQVHRGRRHRDRDVPERRTAGDRPERLRFAAVLTRDHDPVAAAATAAAATRTWTDNTGGFSVEALHERIEDSESRVLITADGFVSWDRGFADDGLGFGRHGHWSIRP